MTLVSAVKYLCLSLFLLKFQSLLPGLKLRATFHILGTRFTTNLQSPKIYVSLQKSYRVKNMSKEVLRKVQYS